MIAFGVQSILDRMSNWFIHWHLLLFPSKVPYIYSQRENWEVIEFCTLNRCLAKSLCPWTKIEAWNRIWKLADLELQCFLFSNCVLHGSENDKAYFSFFDGFSFIFRCASIPWFQVLSESVSNWCFFFSIIQ